MKFMRNYYNPTICFIAFLLLVFSTGCNDPDKSGGAIKGLTPPIVTSVAPPDGTIGACPNTIVTPTFSEAMNPATINGSTFTLTGPSAAVTGVVTYDASSNTAIFTPSSTLALNTLFTGTITTGARDAFGNPLASNFVWTFTTGNTICQPGVPTVLSVAPPNASSGVCPNAVVVATFSVAMNPSTINTATFTLAGASAVTGAVTYDAASHAATFTSARNLALSTLYTATITTGVQDLS